MASILPRCSIRICRCLGGTGGHSTSWRSRQGRGECARNGGILASMSPRRPASPRRRGLPLLAWAALALSASVLGAPAAMAAGLGGRSSFDELNQAVQRQSEGTTTQPASTKSAETSSNSNSGTLLAIGAGVAVVLLGGVAFVIVRDARRVASAGDAGLIESRARS